MKLREKQAEETRKILIETGLELFGKKGFASVSAAEIVNKAELTRGALYHHFKSGVETDKPQSWQANTTKLIRGRQRRRKGKERKKGQSA